MNNGQFLHLEDNPLDAELVRESLESSDLTFTLTSVPHRDAYLSALHERRYDLVISDFKLGSFDGIQAFHALRKRDTSVPFVLVSGALGESRAIECLRLGMTDFVLKTQLERLPQAIERALREAYERRERLAAETALRERQQEVEDLNQRLQHAVLAGHHRIKNNLQVLVALVDAMRVGENSQPEALTRLARHIRGLATLHDLLTHQTITPGAPLDSVSARLALERLIPTLASALDARNLTLDADDDALSLKQVSSVALVVNELVSNAIKHGDGAISVSLKRDGEFLILDVSNDGPGFPEGFDPEHSSGVGLNLIESIGTWDLEGTLAYESTPTGARVQVRFPHLPAA